MDLMDLTIKFDCGHLEDYTESGESFFELMSKLHKLSQMIGTSDCTDCIAKNPEIQKMLENKNGH